MSDLFTPRLNAVKEEFENLITTENSPAKEAGNGIFTRYKNPVVTAAHAPLEWRFDFDAERNPFFMERFGINAAFNAGAMKWEDKYLLSVRVEGYDRKIIFCNCRISKRYRQFQILGKANRHPTN